MITFLCVWFQRSEFTKLPDQMQEKTAGEALAACASPLLHTLTGATADVCTLLIRSIIIKDGLFLIISFFSISRHLSGYIGASL